MSLNDWRSFGWLIEHRPSASEIHDLLVVIDRDLSDCRVEALSPDWRLNIAYNAALQAATAALAAAGYRASRDSHHYRVIQTLADTIGASSTTVARLDLFRKKRNQGGYEKAGAVSRLEALEMIELAEEIVADVRRWLASRHPELLE